MADEGCGAPTGRSDSAWYRCGMCYSKGAGAHGSSRSAVPLRRTHRPPAPAVWGGRSSAASCRARSNTIWLAKNLVDQPVCRGQPVRFGQTLDPLPPVRWRRVAQRPYASAVVAKRCDVLQSVGDIVDRPGGPPGVVPVEDADRPVTRHTRFHRRSFPAPQDLLRAAQAVSAAAIALESAGRMAVDQSHRATLVGPADGGEGPRFDFRRK